MKVSRELKQFIAAAIAVLVGAFGVSADIISANFNAYTAPDVLMEGTYVDAPLSNIVSLLDTGVNGAFKVYGGVGLYNTNSSYSAKILGNNTGNNYLELKTVKVKSGYNLLSQVSSAAVSLTTNWGVKTLFSVNKNGASGSGSQYFGLYASGAMSSTLGGYDYLRLSAANNINAAAALGFSIDVNGRGTLVRTAANNMHEFWNGSAWQTTGTNFISGLNVAGTTQYEISLWNDGSNLNISLINATTSDEIINLSSALSELGSNITGGAGAIRFSAGDIANNSTENWTTNIYSLQQIPEPATIGLMGLATLVVFGLRRCRR